MITVKVLAAQRRAATWAIESVGDYLDHIGYGSSRTLPKLYGGRTLLVPDDEVIVSYLLYKLEEILPELADDADPAQRDDAIEWVRTGEQVAQKLREAWLAAGHGEIVAHVID